MRRRLSVVSACVLAAAVLLLAGCGTSADPETWDQAEEDERFVNDADFPAASAVEYNFLSACVEANSRTLSDAEAMSLCRCSFAGLKRELSLAEFQSVDDALRSTPNPSDLDGDVEDLWDGVVEPILDGCARTVT